MDGLRYFKRKKQGDEGIVATVRAVRTDQITFDPSLPTEEIGITELQPLTDSIRRYGIIEPLIIRERENDGGEKTVCSCASGSKIALVSERVYDPLAPKPLYYIVSGEKRFRAARMLGLETVPCLLTEAGKDDAAALRVILRMTGTAKDPFDDGAFLSAWMRSSGISRSNAARILSVKESDIGELLSYRIFSPLEKQILRLGKIRKEIITALSGVRDPKTRARLLGKIAEEGLSVQQAKKLIAKAQSRKSEVPGKYKGVIRDVRLFYNTFDRAVAYMRGSGFTVDYEKSYESGTAGILILIRSDYVSRETSEET